MVEKSTACIDDEISKVAKTDMTGIRQSEESALHLS